jgi:hypothetical protein
VFPSNCDNGIYGHEDQTLLSKRNNPVAAVGRVPYPFMNYKELKEWKTPEEFKKIMS